MFQKCKLALMLSHVNFTKPLVYTMFSLSSDHLSFILLLSFFVSFPSSLYLACSSLRYHHFEPPVPISPASILHPSLPASTLHPSHPASILHPSHPILRLFISLHATISSLKNPLLTLRTSRNVNSLTCLQLLKTSDSVNLYSSSSFTLSLPLSPPLSCSLSLSLSLSHTHTHTLLPSFLWLLSQNSESKTDRKKGNKMADKAGPPPPPKKKDGTFNIHVK